jgi:Streptococcus thermophilus bacteriophage Gp111 protein
MKNVMKKAWEIAREGAKKFGGKVKEYFAEALRMAWAEIKKSETTIDDLGFVYMGLKQDLHRFIVNADVVVHQIYVRKVLDKGTTSDVKEVLEPIASGKNNKTGADANYYWFDVCSAYEYEITKNGATFRFKPQTGKLVWI